MFSQMASIIPEGEKGIARISHRTPSKLDCMRAAWTREILEERTLATLFVAGEMMMSDGAMEHRSNYEVVFKAHGRVLIGGLGIGMVLDAILKRERVDFVTIVEKYQDVIDLVAPHFQDLRITFVCSDIFGYKPVKGEKFDTIYFDIWPDVRTDNLVSIAALHQRFKSYKAKGGWMGSWNQDLLRYYKSQGR